MQQLADASFVCRQSVNQVDSEAVHAVGDNAHTVQEVSDEDRLEDVQLKLAVHTTDGGGNVVAHDLSADHGESLTLGRVHLSGHDRGTGLVLWEAQLGQTASGTGSEITDILCNLEEGASQGVQGARGFNDGVVGSENLELVGGGLKLGTGDPADLGSDGLVEALEGVQTGTDSRSTLGKEAEMGEGTLDALNVAVELSNVARELLAKGERGGVLQVSSSDLDDLLELLHLGLESVAQVLQGRQKSVLEL